MSTGMTHEEARDALEALALDALDASDRVAVLAHVRDWKERHPGIWAALEPRDVLVDAMRGRFTAWYRIRLNLIHVPADQRPEQEALEVDYDPWKGEDPRGRP